MIPLLKKEGNFLDLMGGWKPDFVKRGITAEEPLRRKLAGESSESVVFFDQQVIRLELVKRNLRRIQRTSKKLNNLDSIAPFVRQEVDDAGILGYHAQNTIAFRRELFRPLSQWCRHRAEEQGKLQGFLSA